MFSLTPSIYIFSSTLIIRTLIALSRPNWFLAWVAIELNLIRFIPHILNSKSHQETEASIKYFLAQALGSALILIGRFSLWRVSINTNISIFILITALFLKLGAVPCHFWFPSVITSISWINAIILSTWQKLAPLMLLAFPLSGNSLLINTAGAVAAINAILGGFIGINQTHLRTLLAYSSVTHSGWIIRALKINIPNITLIYFILYSVIIIPLFTVLISISSRSQLIPLFNRRPVITTTISLLLLSLAGLPPFTGFIPKLLVILHLSGAHLLLIIMLLAGSFINAYYYLNIIFNSITAQINSHSSRKHLRPKKSLIIPIMGATSLLGAFPIFIYALTLLNKS